MRGEAPSSPGTTTAETWPRHSPQKLQPYFKTTISPTIFSLKSEGQENKSREDHVCVSSAAAHARLHPSRSTIGEPWDWEQSTSETWHLEGHLHLWRPAPVAQDCWHRAASVLSKRGASRRLRGGSVTAGASKKAFPCISRPARFLHRHFLARPLRAGCSTQRSSTRMLFACSRSSGAGCGGIASAPSISSRHQFHGGSSNKRSIVLNTKKYNFFILCYLKRDFSWSKPIVPCPVPPEKHCPTGNPAPGISWQHRCSCTPCKSKGRLVPACLKHTSSKIPFILGLGCCGEKA